MERGQWDHYKTMMMNDKGQVGSKHPHHNSTDRMGMGMGTTGMRTKTGTMMMMMMMGMGMGTTTTTGMTTMGV